MPVTGMIKDTLISIALLSSSYGFMLNAIDGAIKGDNTDKFKIKIWDKESGNTIYDNEIGTSEDSEPSTAISGGSIIIHKEK